MPVGWKCNYDTDKCAENLSYNLSYAVTQMNTYDNVVTQWKSLTDHLLNVYKGCHQRAEQYDQEKVQKDQEKTKADQKNLKNQSVDKFD